MNVIKKLNPTWSLRLGLGLMYLYSGSSLFSNPTVWYGFMPQWLVVIVTRVVPMDTYLRIQGIGEFIIGVLLLMWFLGNTWFRIAALLATLEMVFIILFVGVDPITFRDIGLLGGATTLLIISFQNKKGTSFHF